MEAESKRAVVATREVGEVDAVGVHLMFSEFHSRGTLGGNAVVKPWSTLQ